MSLTDTEFSLLVQRIETAHYRGSYYVIGRDAYDLLLHYRQRMQEIRDLKRYRSFLEQELYKPLTLEQLLGKEINVTVYNRRYICRRRLQPLVRLLLKDR